MSIGHIENYPTEPPTDAVEEIDPDEGTSYPENRGGGVDTDESVHYGRGGRREHVDPLGVALLRLGHGRGRELDQQPSPGYEGLMARRGAGDPDAPFRARQAGTFTTGTEQRDERWVHDQALQVRQLAPTSFDQQQALCPLAGSVQVATERPERLTIILVNTDAVNTAYLGRNPAVNSNMGFPLLAGAVLHLDATCAMYMATAPGVTAIIAVLDQYRTDVDAS